MQNVLKAWPLSHNNLHLSVSLFMFLVELQFGLVPTLLSGKLLRDFIGSEPETYPGPLPQHNDRWVVLVPTHFRATLRMERLTASIAFILFIHLYSCWPTSVVWQSIPDLLDFSQTDGTAVKRRNTEMNIQKKRDLSEYMWDQKMESKLKQSFVYLSEVTTFSRLRSRWIPSLSRER